MSTTARSARKNRLTRLEIALLAVGLLALSVWLSSIVRTRLVQRHESSMFDKDVQHLANKPSPFAGRSTRGCGRSPSPGGCPQAPVAQNGLIGRLSIPRLGLQAMVREGDSAGTLSVALGHIPGTAMPGQNGNVGVAGHRDTLFRGLGAVRLDDVIVFETLQGTYRYQVDNTQVVKPTDVAVLRDRKFPELTLVTCYPFYYVGAAPDRFIVTAHLQPENAAVPLPKPGVNSVEFHSLRHIGGHSGSTVAMKSD